jgi:hypothetical protein
VLVNSVVQAFSSRETALNAAMASAIAVGVLVVLLRLVRQETLQQAVSGFIGLAIAVFFARRSGEARGFFLPGIFINIAYGLVFLGSALIGRPARRARSTRRSTASTSAGARTRGCGASSPSRPSGWSLVFASRAVVQGVLYAMDRPGLLAGARLLMGWPLTIAAVALTVAYVKRARARQQSEQL